jgi:tellurite resistance protein
LILDQSHPGLIWAETTKRRHTFSGKGYEETAEEGPLSRALAIKLAVAIAFADTGGFTEEEASAIQKWMTLQLRRYEGQPGPRGTFKKLLNDALKEAHALGNIGKQGRKRLAHRLGKIGEQTDHYTALALCIDVMVSDRVADSNELQAIREIAEALNLDSANVQELLHTRMTQLDLDTEQGSAEDFLGIDPKWDKKTICKSIRTQFIRANADLSVLTDQVERRNVQRQLDALGDLHKKYKC